MPSLVLRGGVLALTLVLIAGCLPSKPGAPKSANAAPSPQVQATPGQLVATIIEMSQDMEKYGDTVDRHVYTEALANMGPTALLPLLDYMQAPDTGQMSRLFILQCVSSHLTPAYLPNITPMVESEDEVIRAIGVTLLGEVRDDSVVPLLQEAKNDPAPGVAFSAISSLAMHGDAESREQLKEMYLTGTTMGDIPTEQVNREIIRVMVLDPRPEDLPLLTEALNQPYLEVNNRAAILRVLGRMGDASAIPVIEQSLGLQTEPAYAQLAQEVIAAIRERDAKA